MKSDAFQGHCGRESDGMWKPVTRDVWIVTDSELEDWLISGSTIESGKGRKLGPWSIPKVSIRIDDDIKLYSTFARLGMLRSTIKYC
jgi:hypothetical protein